MGTHQIVIDSLDDFVTWISLHIDEHGVTTDARLVAYFVTCLRPHPPYQTDWSEYLKDIHNTILSNAIRSFATDAN